MLEKMGWLAGWLAWTFYHLRCVHLPILVFPFPFLFLSTFWIPLYSRMILKSML